VTCRCVGAAIGAAFAESHRHTLSYGLFSASERSEEAEKEAASKHHGGYMARCRVELVQTVVETAVCWIEANNEAEAEELALARGDRTGVLPARSTRRF